MEQITESRPSRIMVGHIITITRTYNASPKEVTGLVTNVRTIVNITGEDEVIVTLLHGDEHVIHQRHKVIIHHHITQEYILELLKGPKPPEVKYVQLNRAPKTYHPVPVDSEF